MRNVKDSKDDKLIHTLFEQGNLASKKSTCMRLLKSWVQQQPGTSGLEKLHNLPTNPDSPKINELPEYIQNLLRHSDLREVENVREAIEELLNLGSKVLNL